MSPLILLGLLVGLPLLLTIVLRVKPLYVFVSIICGYFWAQLLGESVELMLGSVIHTNNLAVLVRVALLVLPLTVTLFLMRKTLSASALPFQFGLLLADSILLATFLIPLLSSGLQSTLYSTHAGNVFRQAHDLLITGIAGIHVLVMWIMRPKPHHDDGHHGKHKKH